MLTGIDTPKPGPHLWGGGLLLEGTWVPTVQCWPGDPQQEGVTAMERLQVILGTFTRLQAWGAARKGHSWLCYL